MENSYAGRNAGSERAENFFLSHDWTHDPRHRCYNINIRNWKHAQKMQEQNVPWSEVPVGKISD